MPNDIWINLPVKDVDRARAFFTSTGFQLNPHFGHGPDSVSLVVGERQVIVMLFDEETFAGFAGQPVADPAAGTEVLLSIGLESREAVDALAENVATAGGTVFSEPGEIDGWMYGMGFIDPDGHRWNAVYMDFTRMPRERPQRPD